MKISATKLTPPALRSTSFEQVQSSKSAVQPSKPAVTAGRSAWSLFNQAQPASFLCRIASKPGFEPTLSDMPEVSFMANGPTTNRSIIGCTARWMALAMLTLQFCISTTLADEGVGRGGLKEVASVEAEAEFYSGKRGYLHGGLGIVLQINERQKIGIVGHVVREETGGELFPSLGAEFIQKLGDGFEVEGFSFGYFPVEKQHAWAVGLRGSRQWTLSDGVSITPFFGPTYARVQALDEASETPVHISHLMLMGGIAVEMGPVEMTVFGSHSFFSRNPEGLETHVDLEEMTHFAAYENNDGFARNTVGSELSYSPTDWLTLTGRYALILYQDETRHSVSFTPALKLGGHSEVFVGVQFLRGDGMENDLVMAGASFSF